MFDDIPKNINLNNEIKAKTISNDKWNEELSKLRVNRQEMNKIILNYLIIEGYKDAVEKFVKETGTEGNIDLVLFKTFISFICYS